jgi:hypothetical protein
MMKAKSWRDGLCVVPLTWDETELVPSVKVWFIAIFFGATLWTHAQESPTPAASATSTATVTPTATATPMPVLVPSPSITASPAVRSVRIRFLPPPLEGTISLGIYNAWDQLVRVLHQEATLDEFTIGEDFLSTKWDGKDDDGVDLPPGKYQARGFAVGNLKTETVASSPGAPAEAGAAPTLSVRLVANPLANDERNVIVLSVGFDDENSFLKTADGLPLYTLAKKPNVRRASLARAGQRSIMVWEDDGTTVEQLRVSNIDKMMAFDCGDFELK